MSVPEGVNSAYTVPDDVIGVLGGEGGTWALNSVRDSVGIAPRGRDLGWGSGPRGNVPEGVHSAYTVPDDVIAVLGGRGVGTWGLDTYESA